MFLDIDSGFASNKFTYNKNNKNPLELPTIIGISLPKWWNFNDCPCWIFVVRTFRMIEDFVRCYFEPVEFAKFSYRIQYSGSPIEKYYQTLNIYWLNKNLGIKQIYLKKIFDKKSNYVYYLKFKVHMFLCHKFFLCWNAASNQRFGTDLKRVFVIFSTWLPFNYGHFLAKTKFYITSMQQLEENSI